MILYRSETSWMDGEKRSHNSIKCRFFVVAESSSKKKEDAQPILPPILPPISSQISPTNSPPRGFHEEDKATHLPPTHGHAANIAPLYMLPPDIYTRALEEWQQHIQQYRCIIQAMMKPPVSYDSRLMLHPPNEQVRSFKILIFRFLSRCPFCPNFVNLFGNKSSEHKNS